jgi:hypothetical protein
MIFGRLDTGITINTELIKAVESIPLQLRNGPFGRCLGKFGNVVARATPALARSSRQSGSRLKWWKPYKDNPAFQNDSRKTFTYKVLKNGLCVLVGPVYNQGNKQQFVMPRKNGDTYVHVLWGRRTGRTITYPMHERAHVRAFNQNETTASSAYLSQLEKECKELNLG